MNLPKYTSILFLLILLTNTNLNSQTYRFENLTSDDGLSQNTVLCIYQDSRNFLWLGTYDGLNRYDGYKFKIYKTDKRNPNSINGQSFISIIEDQYGNLWIGSLGGGLNKYNRSSDNFTKFIHNSSDSTSIPNNRIRAFLIDKSGKFWIGTEGGLCIYDFEKSTFTSLNKILGVENDIYQQFITSICEDGDGNIWIGTYSGLIKYNPFTNQKKYYTNQYDNMNSISGNYIGKIYRDSRNNIWIGTGEGLNKYDSFSDTFIRYNNEYLSSSNDKNVKDILEDNSGNLWIATNLVGLFQLDTSTNSFTNFQHNPYDRTSITSNIVHSLFEDKTGIIWIGTEGGGVNKLIRRKSQFKSYTARSTGNEGLSNNNVYSIVEDKDENLWLGTYGGGLNKFETKKLKNRFSFFVYDPDNSNSLIDNRIRSIFKDNNGILWIGTDNGLTEYNTLTGKLINHSETNQNSINNRAIFSIHQLKSGEILIGTFGGGINVYDKKKNNFSYIRHIPGNPNSLSSDMIWRIFEDSKGRIWVGTENDGVDLFYRKENAFYNYKHNPKDSKSISSNMVLTIIEDKRGTIWLGTTQGLNKTIINENNPKEITFINYSINDGLPDNNVQGMLEDNKGNLWLSTNKGLSKFCPVTETFENYDISDGLQSNEFFVNSCYKRKNGELIFGGNRGFIIFHPDSIQIDTTKPKVMVTDFLLYNASVPINEAVDDNIILKQNITETKEIVLTHWQNVLSFEFSALHFAAPDKNTYAYIMEGLESNWNYSGNRNFATYSRIPPGEYIFKVKAANPNKIWSDENFELKIKILPPFYETTWFRILGVVFISLLIYSSYLWKMSNLKKRQTELEGLINEKTELNEKLIKEINERKDIEQELIIAKERAEGSERLKSEFLAQMSHEIRSPVNTILNFTDLIKETIEKEKDEIIKESFDSIENAGERIVRTIDLILNMSELQTGNYECIYKEINLKNTIERLYSEFTYKANKKKIDLVLSLESDELIIFADEYSVTQIFVNLIDNAIKYTNKGKVEIKNPKNKMEKVIVEITDTGIGMSEDYMQNLFIPFNQEQKGYSRQYEGNGLGLALVKKYCEMNNALIYAKSKKGEGSTFTVIFNNVTNYSSTTK